MQSIDESVEDLVKVSVGADVPEEHRDSVREASNSCPEQAISVMVDRVLEARAVHGRRREF
jgi:ferredoxin